jgi:ABC-2 type transport system ATP-binding protein
MTTLADAGATVATTGPDTLTVTGLVSEQIIEVLGRGGVPLSEVTVHRSSLEEAYMDLTRDAVEFSAAPTADVAR